MTIDTATLQKFVTLMNGPARLKTPDNKPIFVDLARQVLEEMASQMGLVTKDIVHLPGGKDHADTLLMRGYFPNGEGIKVSFDGGKMCYQCFEFYPCDRSKRDGKMLRAGYAELLDMAAMCQSLHDRISKPPVDSCDRSTPAAGKASDLRVENGRLAGTLKF